MNQVILTGNLGADPELRYTASGQAVTRFRMAVNENYVNREGEKITRTDWFTIITWGRLAEVVSKYLRKGRGVQVLGRIRTDTIESEDGTTRKVFWVVAREVKFLPGGQNREEEQNKVDEAIATAVAMAEGELPF